MITRRGKWFLIASPLAICKLASFKNLCHDGDLKAFQEIAFSIAKMFNAVSNLN
ncbi:MAG: hypothetical protein P4L31_07090 [Candidatus Babeliales bacterium]|nr:hypothetical protein [Candidatus Babeliales bacterium]